MDEAFSSLRERFSRSAPGTASSGLVGTTDTARPQPRSSVLTTPSTPVLLLLTGWAEEEKDKVFSESAKADTKDEKDELSTVPAETESQDDDRNGKQIPKPDEIISLEGRTGAARMPFTPRPHSRIATSVRFVRLYRSPEGLDPPALSKEMDDVNAAYSWYFDLCMRFRNPDKYNAPIKDDVFKSDEPVESTLATFVGACGLLSRTTFDVYILNENTDLTAEARALLDFDRHERLELVPDDPRSEPGPSGSHHLRWAWTDEPKPLYVSISEADFQSLGLNETQKRTIHAHKSQ